MAGVFTWFLLALSPVGVIPYSDIPAFLISCLFLYLYSLPINYQAIISLGLLSGIAFLLKPSLIIFDIALLIVKLFDLKKIKNNKINDLSTKLEYAKDKYILIKYQDMLKQYKVIFKLNKNDLVKITTKKDKVGLGYIVGMTGGLLEIKSLIGDNYNLIGENNLFINKVERYRIVVSQIKSIDKLSINLLGEISGL